MGLDGYSRRNDEQRDIQPVAIQSVNAAERSAQVLTRSKVMITVDCSYSTGDTTVVPAVGEQWYIERFQATWRLYGRIPFNDPTLLTEPEEGQVSVGSGRGPVELHGNEIRMHGELVLGDDHYRSEAGQLQKQTADGSWVPVIPASGSHVIATDISDSTALGRSILTAPNSDSVRSLILAGDYTKPAGGIPKADLAAAVQASLALADTAKQTVGAIDIYDSSGIGRQLLTATNTAAARAALNIGTGTTVASTDIVDSSSVGRSVLTATDAAAARTAIGAQAAITNGSIALASLTTSVQASLAKADSAVQTIPPIADGSLGLAKLSATGTRNASTVLRGDNTWGAGSVASAAIMSRTLTATVNMASGNNTLGGYFNVDTYHTTDITPDLTTGKFTVTIAGIYMVKVLYKKNLSVAPFGSAAPVLFKNGAAFQWDAQTATFTDGNGFATLFGNHFVGSWIVPLAANDTVQAGYNASGSFANLLTGEATGAQAYFSLALLSNG